MRRAIVVALGALAATGLVACEPPPVVPTFTVTTHLDLPDAAPGDGLCEATPGAGDCTLRAAVHEANAGTGATVVLPAIPFRLGYEGEPDAHADLDVTSPVTLLGSGDEAIDTPIEWGWEQVVQVHASGALAVDRVALGQVEVAGHLDARRSVFLSWYSTPLHVVAGGSASLVNVEVLVDGYDGILNEGDLSLLYTSLLGRDADWLVSTQGAGVTRAGATLLLNADYWDFVTSLNVHCTGNAVQSWGRNYAGAYDCGFAAPGDVPPASPRWPVKITAPIPPDAASVDRVPVGTLGCGEGVVESLDGVRPVDGDADTVVACDIGARERTP